MHDHDTEVGLEPLGWNRWFAERFEQFRTTGCEPARVVFQHARLYRVLGAGPERLGALSGKLRHQIQSPTEYPVAGDWVAVRPLSGERKATIHGVLPRRTKFSRKVAGETTEEQIVAANIDTVFLMTSLDATFSLRRVERYLLLAWTSGADPVILLTKADVCATLNDRLDEMTSVAAGVPVHAISSTTGQGLDEVQRYLVKGRTLALLGSSGVGKSTLINRLLGRDQLRTASVRAKDSRGRHTTTHRELIVLPGGALVIDTPGMRELQLWESAQDGIEEAFPDIEGLAVDCHFRDCRHEHEPRCAVKQAVEDGRLPADRLESYRKLDRELAHLVRKQDQLAQIAEKKRIKTIMKAVNRQKPRQI